MNPNELKAREWFLAWHDQPFRQTHDLEEIGSATLQPITTAADALTDFAWRPRYPGNLYALAEGEVAEMLALATSIV